MHGDQQLFARRAGPIRRDAPRNFLCGQHFRTPFFPPNPQGELHEEYPFYSIEIKETSPEKVDQATRDQIRNFPTIKDGPYVISKDLLIKNYIFLAHCYYSDKTVSNIICYVLMTNLWIVIVPDQTIPNYTELKNFILIPNSRILDISKIKHKDGEITWKFGFRIDHHFTITASDSHTTTKVEQLRSQMGKLTNYLKKVLIRVDKLSASYNKAFKGCCLDSVDFE
jgi:hypothetical protein